MRKEGKTEAQIDVAAKLPDERMAARKLRREAGGESLLKPYGMGRQPNPRGGGK